MFDDKIEGDVKQFSYRTARVTDVFMELPRRACKEIEAQLAQAAGKEPDNHTVYELKQNAGWSGHESVTYIWCHDLTMAFGKGVIEERY